MVRARRAILDAGGAHACNSFTRFYLALLGQIAYDECPCVPPELVLIPSRWNFSLSAMSAWTRTIVVPLSIMSYYKPVRTLRPEQGIAELFAAHRPGRASRRPLVLVDQFLPGGGPGAQVARPARACRLATAGDPGGAPLDARALRRHRRPGGDLPADGLFDHRAQVPGLRAGFARGPVGDGAARRPADRRGRPRASSAVPLAGLGHGDRHDRAGRRRRARGTSSLGAGGRLAACQGGAGPPETGRSAARASSRPAGTSSFATRSIPTSTIPRW